jgi:bifunctional NMN adenylyltransferase/nudix hydrolase
MKTIEQNADVGVIVARFQTPFLHEGHQEIIEAVRKAHSRTIVILGVSPLKCTQNNPLDFVTRKSMVEEQYKDVEVLYLDDVGDNIIWSRNLDNLLRTTLGPTHKAVLYGSRDSFIDAYCGKFPTIAFAPSKIISATEIRRRVGIKSKSTQDFREGIVHAVQNQFPSFQLTVDIAVINFDTKELLLARKSNRNTLCFPGGFTDPTVDKSIEEAAIRELREETRLIVDNPTYIGSSMIDDWRYRGEVNKIMTALFVVKYNGGTAVANDDIVHVIWKKFGELTLQEVSKSHHPLIHMLNKYFSNKILASIAEANQQK